MSLSLISIPNTFEANTVTDADKVNENFDEVTSKTNAAINELNSGISGQIAMYGGDSAPTGWLLCDGSAVSRSTYSDLFTAISTKYGSGDGSTTFNLPDFSGAFPIGLDSGDGDFNDRGKTGGAKTTNALHFHTVNGHSHSVNSHTHTISDHTHTGPSHNHSISSSGNHSHTIAGSTGTPSASEDVEDYSSDAASVPESNHTHSMNFTSSSAGDHTHGGATGAGGTGNTGSGGSGNTGGTSLSTTNTAPDTNNALSASQSIMNPFLVVNFLIKI